MNKCKTCGSPVTNPVKGQLINYCSYDCRPGNQRTDKRLKELGLYRPNQCHRREWTEEQRIKQSETIRELRKTVPIWNKVKDGYTQEKWKDFRGGRPPPHKRQYGDIWAIKQFYKNRPDGYQVDHIVPLNGKKVSGLHTRENLQYLTIEQNKIKNNKF